MLENRFDASARSSDQCMQPGNQLFQVKWLDQIIIRADVEPEYALRRRVPGVSPSVRGGLYLEREASVDPPRFAAAVALAAARAGAEIRAETPVARIVVEGGRARGVRTVSGESIDAGTVVLAAGAWSAFGGALPVPIPVTPAKGQMLAIDGRGFACAGPTVRQGIYLVPRPEGRCLVGATVEDVGFDKGSTVGGVQWLLAGVIALVPGLRDARVLETWAGLRPKPADGLPLLGPAGAEGLIVATGHFRNGILLTPATAEIVAGLVTEGRSPVPLGPFRADRFAAVAAGGR